MKVVSWDIEIADEMEGGFSMENMPFGITCASTVTSFGDNYVWYPQEGDQAVGREQAGLGVELWHCEDEQMLSPKMTRDELWDMTAYMLGLQDRGYPVLAWNGLHFDFQVLAAEFEDVKARQRIAKLAMGSIDPFFTMSIRLGFAVGLDNAAIGLGVEGKLGHYGAAAPTMWKESRKQQNLVLDYVLQDSVATLNVLFAILDQCRIAWKKRNGQLGIRSIPLWLDNPHKGAGHGRMLASNLFELNTSVEDVRFPTVRESLAIPDHGRRNPFPCTREEFLAWVVEIDPSLV